MASASPVVVAAAGGNAYGATKARSGSEAGRHHDCFVMPARLAAASGYVPLSSNAQPARRIGLFDLAADASAEQVQILVDLLHQHPRVVVLAVAQALPRLAQPLTGDFQTLVNQLLDVLEGGRLILAGRLRTPLGDAVGDAFAEDANVFGAVMPRRTVPLWMATSSIVVFWSGNRILSLRRVERTSMEEPFQYVSRLSAG